MLFVALIIVKHLFISHLPYRRGDPRQDELDDALRFRVAGIIILVEDLFHFCKRVVLQEDALR